MAACSTKSGIKNGGDDGVNSVSTEMIANQTRQPVLPPARSEIKNFATTLFEAVCESDRDKNICISPTSATWALSMVANGASGTTLHEMLQTLGYDNIETLNKEQATLITSLATKDETTRLSIANSIWINNLPVNEDFISINRKYYDATVQSEIFDKSTFEKINNWCSEKTEGKIKSILDKPNNNTKMLLLNALYLKSSWARPFDKNATANHIFTKSNGEEMVVKMMKQKFRTAYFENDSMQIASKHLHGGFEMLFILPRKGIEIKEIAATMTENYDTIRQQMKTSKEVIMGVPRFKAEYNVSLKPMLQSSGIESAFSGEANFEKISEKPLYLDDVIQKSYIAVNEEGVEAAAVTAAMMNMLAMRPSEQPKEMIMDRPFIYMITHKNNDKETILFIGKTEEPKE